jgi:peptide/nickel transport system ATP-binding protein
MTALSPVAKTQLDVPMLQIKDLNVRFRLADRDVYAVNGVDLEVDAGEVFALVGESGSGKSVSALSIMGLVPTPPAEISGSIQLQGRELTSLKKREMSAIRGREIGMVFQDPMSSMNPVHPVGRQVAEGLRLHFGISRKEAKERAVELLDSVGIPDPKARAQAFPHEFSGGMRQRAVIAMALACDPKLLIADEPTTALDVTVQRQIVELVQQLQQDRGMAVIWITHDLGVVAEIADRVAVMYGGRIMEEGAAADIYSETRHPYTSGLLRSIPRMDRSTAIRLAEIPGAPATQLEALSSCPFHDRCPMGDSSCVGALPELENAGGPGHSTACAHLGNLTEMDEMWTEVAFDQSTSSTNSEPLVEVSDLSVHFPTRRRDSSGRRVKIRAVDGVNLVIRKGQTLGVVGESGCGKSTLGRALVGLVEPTGGSITIHGEPMAKASSKSHKAVQMIFQDPFSSMNPGMRIKDIIAEPLKIHSSLPPEQIKQRVFELLELVNLPADSAERHPHEFSGGQRQRIAIARALAAEPEVIVCDEPVSALDVSVQAQIINLLHDLQKREGVAFLFIAHDLAVVRHISDEVAVMYLGQIVERAARDELYDAPLHPYTKALLAAVPVPDPGSSNAGEPLSGSVPSPSAPPAGCRFHTRCPVAVERCSTVVPEFSEVAPGRWVACHLVESPLTLQGAAASP